MATATEMEMMDLVAGVVEICTVCGCEHTTKSPVCDDCAFIQWVDGQEERPEAQEEPITFELMAF